MNLCSYVWTRKDIEISDENVHIIYSKNHLKALIKHFFSLVSHSNVDITLLFSFKD